MNITRQVGVCAPSPQKPERTPAWPLVLLATWPGPCAVRASSLCPARCRGCSDVRRGMPGQRGGDAEVFCGWERRTADEMALRARNHGAHGPRCEGVCGPWRGPATARDCRRLPWRTLAHIAAECSLRPLMLSSRHNHSALPEPASFRALGPPAPASVRTGPKSGPTTPSSGDLPRALIVTTASMPHESISLPHRARCLAHLESSSCLRWR